MGKKQNPITFSLPRRVLGSPSFRGPGWPVDCHGWTLTAKLAGLLGWVCEAQDMGARGSGVRGRQIVPLPLRSHQAQGGSRAFVPWSPTSRDRCGPWCDDSVPQLPLPKVGSVGGSGWMILSLVKMVGSQWPGGLPLSHEQGVPAGSLQSRLGS